MRILLLLIGTVVGNVSALPPASLEDAAGMGDLNAVKQFLAEGADVHADEVASSAICQALLNNKMNIYRYLRDIHGADVNRISGQLRWTALHCAVHRGNVENVREVLNDGNSIEARQQENWTPLLQSIHSGDMDVTRELINRGADIHALDNRGFNALMSAIFYKRRELALELIALGSNVNVRAPSGRQETPLLMAVDRGWEDVATALIEAGADINVQDRYGTPLLNIAAKAGLVEFVRTLLTKGAEPNGSDPIRIALEARTKADRNLLFNAIIGGDIDSVRKTLIDGADINARDARGFTPLMFAIERGNREIALELIAWGSPVKVQRSSGKFETPLHMAVAAGWEDVALALVEAGAVVDAEDSSGATPLIYAASEGFVGIARMLIDQGADVDIVMERDNRECAILAPHITKNDNRMEMTRFLLEEGNADPNLVLDCEDLPLLHIVAQRRLRGVARLLIDFGADAEFRDENGRTAQDIARSFLGSDNPDLNEEWVAEFAP